MTEKLLPMAAIFVSCVLPGVLMGANAGDSAIFSALKHTDPSLAHFEMMQRTGVTGELDLVIAIGSAKPFGTLPETWMWWGEDRKLALFLQEKRRPNVAYLLGSKAGSMDCAARVERATASDVVIACEGEMQIHQNQKWVYDIRAKIVLRQFAYQPFAMQHIFESDGRPILIGSDAQRPVAARYDPDRNEPFEVLSEDEARRLTARSDKASPPKTLPALPRTTYDQFAAARPRRVKDGYSRKGSEISDAIGPWKREGSRIWFGKSFYDGEGSTGVGGFGYFDSVERGFHLFQPPEIADWSVSALDVGRDVVWMGLVQNDESRGSSGGLLRYDRSSGESKHFELHDIVNDLVCAGGKLLAATNFGMAVVEGDRIDRYFVDRTGDGRLRVVSAVH